MSAASIMIVEDDADVRETMAQVLESEGHRVTTARDGTDALEAFARGERPQLIVLDLMMPGMNGWEFRARQREHPSWARIPVVILSACGDSATEIVRDTEVHAYLRKPFKVRALVSALAQVGELRVAEEAIVELEGGVTPGAARRRCS